MSNGLNKAEFLTGFLINWHRHIGLKRSSDIRVDRDRSRYLEAVQHFLDLDLSDPHNMKQIATAQYQGPLETFYNVPVDDRTWREMCRRYQIQMPPLTSLGEIGKQILNLLKDFANQKGVDEGFRLPENWINESTSLSPNVNRISLRPDETPREALRAYFSALLKGDSDVLGGRELMVSMNEDVQRPFNEVGEQQISVYSPGSFGFQLVNKNDDADNIVVRLIDGDIQVTQITLDLEELETETGGRDDRPNR